MHDAEIDMQALHELMKSTDLSERIHYYNPRADAKQLRFYATTSEETVECPMSWAQTFRYLMHRRQSFSIQLPNDDGPRVRMCSTRNTYNTLLRSISNNPFPDHPEYSPKFAHVLERMEEIHKETPLRQVVYSCRRDTGVTALKSLWLRDHKKSSVFEINGSMTDEDRLQQVDALAKTPRGVIFITDAGGQGIDFKYVGAIHIVEPSENLQEERQVINRAIRFKAHRQRNTIVRVFLYISTFPKTRMVAAPWKQELYRSGLFAKHELHGITIPVQDALIVMIREEENRQTIDETIVIRRKLRDEDIQAKIQDLKSCALVPPSMHETSTKVLQDGTTANDSGSEESKNEDSDDNDDNLEEGVVVDNPCLD